MVDKPDKRAAKAEEISGINRTPLVLIALHVLLLVYSFSGIFSKNASAQPFLSPMFCILYAGTIVILGIYAVGWQQIIKRLPLTLAFANKAVTVVWGIVWGALLFGETITWQMVVGGIVVIAGVALFGYADAREQAQRQLDATTDQAQWQLDTAGEQAQQQLDTAGDQAGDA